MSAKETSGHVIPSLNKFLISIEKICSANHTVVFTNIDVTICKSLQQIPEHEVVLIGHRNSTNGTDLNNIKSNSVNKVDHVQNGTTKISIIFYT